MSNNFEDAAWCRWMFDMLSVGGVWSVPRSGLIFKKQDSRTFHLVAAMPWSADIHVAAEEGRGVPKTKEELAAYQRADFDIIQNRFNQCDIEVTGREKL